MTPLTKEQAEALADRIEARAAESILLVADTNSVQSIRYLAARAETFRDLATEIRDGTFIEVQHD